MLIDATLALLPSTIAGAQSFDYFLTIGVEATISLEVVFATGPYIAKDLELTWPMNAKVHHLIKVGEHTSVKLKTELLKSDCTRCMHGQLMFLHSCQTYACLISFLRFDMSLRATKAFLDSSCDSEHC